MQNPFGSLFELPAPPRRMSDTLARLKKPPSLKRPAPLNHDNDTLLQRIWATRILAHWAATKLQPSLVDTPTDFFVLRCKTIISLALKRWIGKKRGTPSTATTTERAKVAVPELDWVVPALIGQNNAAAAAFELCSTLISTGDNAAYFVEMYVWVLANTAVEQSSQVCLHLHKLLLEHHYKLANGVGQLVQRNLLQLIELSVGSELATSAGKPATAASLEPCVQLATLLFVENEPIDLFLHVALMDGLSGYGMDFAQYNSLCKLRDIWVNAKKQTQILQNDSAASTLLLLSSRLCARIADCFPYCKAMNFALEQVTLAAKHEHPTTSSHDGVDDDDENGHYMSHHHHAAMSIQLIRAPTQEEYFRTSLRDPVLSLRCINANNHPTVAELVQQIARELETDAELLELICCNKILKPTLDLNQVYEKLWKPHIRARRRNSSGGEDQIMRDVAVDDDGEDEGYDDEDEDYDDEVMAIIYRIVAIDGEASEDFLTELPTADGVVDAPNAVEPNEGEAKPEEQNLGFPLTKSLVGNGFQAIVALFHTLTASQKELDWPRDLRSALAMSALRLLECSALANLQELQMCGIIPALLQYLFCYANEEEEACKLCLQVLEQVCKHFKFVEHEDPGYLEQVVQLLDSLEQYKPSVSRLLPRLTGQQSSKAAQLIALLPSTWLESVLFECNDDQEDQFLRACYVGGITQTCIDALHIDSIAQEPSLRSLKLLKGLSRESQSAGLVCQHSNALRELVLIEEVPNAKVPLVGDLAGAVLELLSHSFPTEVQAQQQARRNELAAMSTKKRQKKERAQLRKQQKMTLPMHFEDVAAGGGGEEEVHPKDRLLRCCVCYEGYQAKPDALLCTYVYCKQVPNSQLPTSYSSVSSFVLIHSACHDKAFATEGELRQARDEWEGAQIRNGHAACNNLLPVLLRLDDNVASLPAQFHVAQKKYFDRLGVVINSAKADFMAKDIRLLLLRIAFEESLIVHTGGGSVESNLQLVVPLMQLACHNLDDDYLLNKAEEKDLDRQLVYNLIKAKANASSSNEWMETRATSFKLFIRWAEQTSIHGSTLIQPSKHKLKLKPWYVFFGLVDFMMEENRFMVYKQDVYEMLDCSQALAMFARKLIALPTLEACSDMLKLQGSS